MSVSLQRVSSSKEIWSQVVLSVLSRPTPALREFLAPEQIIDLDVTNPGPQLARLAMHHLASLVVVPAASPERGWAEGLARVVDSILVGGGEVAVMAEPQSPPADHAVQVAAVLRSGAHVRWSAQSIGAKIPWWVGWKERTGGLGATAPLVPLEISEPPRASHSGTWRGTVTRAPDYLVDPDGTWQRSGRW